VSSEIETIERTYVWRIVVATTLESKFVDL
jgi:hypothetical protein